MAAGVVSIDDNESENLRAMMNEIFGEENFVAQVVWQRSNKGDAKLIAGVHEYILCYVRDQGAAIAAGVWRRKKDGAAEALAQYAEFGVQFAGDHERIRTAMQQWYRGLKDGDPRKDHAHYSWSDDRGLYFAADFAGPDDGRASRPRHDIFHPVTGKPCKKPSTGWRWDDEKTNWALAQTPPRIHFGVDESTIPNRKSYLAEISVEPYPSVFYRDGRSATLEVEGLVGKGVFPFPKNTDVLAELIELTTGPSDIVMDFFAGSGSTGHAVMNVNSANDSHRRFLLVQLPERTGRADYPTISSITKQRLRKAGEKVRGQNALFAGDVGFRVFSLDTSNIRSWEPDRDDMERSLLDHETHLREGRADLDVIHELLLKLGLDLCVPVERRVLGGKDVYSIAGGVLFACLATSITREDVEPVAEGIVGWRDSLRPAGETVCVFRDSAFSDDVAKSNLAAILSQHGLTNVRSL